MAMPFALQRHTEPLSENELHFLFVKERRERKQYYRVFRLLMIVSFVMPFITAWYRAAEGAPNAFSKMKFFVTATVLLFISVSSTYITYRVNLRKVQLDLKYRTKTIDINRITKKLYIATKNACYLYIDSGIKLSIEVSVADFERLNEGDEVSIEYTTHSRQYLGYF
jgi:hypothetical protein